MSRKPVTGIILITLIVVAGVVFLLLFRPTAGGNDIVLMPGIADDPESPVLSGAEENRKKLEAVVIDGTNVQSVLATLIRPPRYQLKANLTYYFETAPGQLESQVFTVTALVEPNRSKTVLAAASASAQTQVHTLQAGDRTYIWEQGSASVYEGSAGSFLTDDLLHMPTYEDLLARPASTIEDGWLDSASDCVVVQSVDTDTGYVERWSVSIREGLLLDYRCFDGETPVFEATVQEARTGGEGITDANFALPDGTIPPV